MTFKSLILLVAAIFSASAFAEPGRVYDVAEFNKIDIKGDLELHIKQGAAQSVRITADDAAFKNLDVYVANSELNIVPKTRGWNWPWQKSQKIKVDLTVKDLVEIDVSGAVRIAALGLDVNELGLDASGAVEARMTGKAKKFSLDVSGAANVNATDFVAEVVEAGVSGAGNVQVHATKILDVDISGAAEFTYAGNPAKVKSEVSGAATIMPRG